MNQCSLSAVEEMSMEVLCRTYWNSRSSTVAVIMRQTWFKSSLGNCLKGNNKV